MFKVWWGCTCVFYRTLVRSLVMLVSDPLPNWLTDSCLVNLIDVTLACEDANSKLVDVVTVADEDCVGNNLLQISKLRFGQKAKLLFRFWAYGLVKILKLKFRQDLQLGRDSEARFEQVLWRGWCLDEILKFWLGRDSEDELWSRFVWELVIWTQSSWLEMTSIHLFFVCFFKQTCKGCPNLPILQFFLKHSTKRPPPHPPFEHLAKHCHCHCQFYAFTKGLYEF